MSKLIKVIWFNRKASLAEVYQQTGMLFAFASSPRNNMSQCHEWVKCRDFLPDAVRSQITNKPCLIYGFKFDTNENPAIDLNKMRMLVTKSVKSENNISEFEQKIRHGLKLINHYETMAGVGKSKINKVDITGQNKYKSIFLFTGSVMWLRSPFLVSMYTFLIRLCDKKIQFTNNSELKTKLKELADEYSSGKINDNDAAYLINSWDKLDLIIKNRSKLFPIKNRVHDIYWKKYAINTFHNTTGLNSLARAATPDKDLNSKIKALKQK